MARTRKAFVAAASAGAAALLGGLAGKGVPADSAGWAALLSTVLGAALVAGYAVWRVPNARAQ
jgi:hypothetical protein